MKKQILFVLTLTVVMNSCDFAQNMNSNEGKNIAYNTQVCTYEELNSKLTCKEKVYKTTKIGTQIWLAENLSFMPTDARTWCFQDSVSNCEKFGRLYDWATAKKMCPTGWHLPKLSEWDTLASFVGGVEVAGDMIKGPQYSDSTSTIYDTLINQFLVPDTYKFSALFGEFEPYFIFIYTLPSGHWWADKGENTFANGNSKYFNNSNQLYNDSSAFNVWIMMGFEGMNANISDTTNAYSVRCIKNTGT